MIDKLIAISRVGKFWHYFAQGQTNFQRMTLIFAENGCGKTTLASILRSLSGNEVTLINERRTLGSADEPRIELRSHSGTHVFENGEWSSNFTDIEVFDDAFVYENVYAGPLVTLEQRRSLHKIIIGSRGVTLAREIEQLDDKIRNINFQLHYLSDRILPHAGTLSVDQFCNVVAIEDIDDRVEAKLTELEAKKSASAIREATPFSIIDLPPIAVGELEQLLQAGVDDLSAETDRRLQEHFSHIGANSETWVANGNNRIADEKCPFCNQSISNQAIIGDYRAHFSSSYRELKANIERMRGDIARVLGGDKVAEIMQQIA